MNKLHQFIQEVPKAELHLHIEGSFEPELMFQIAERNGIDIPYNSVSELKQAYEFDCLQDFLDIYYQGAQVLRHEQDFYDLTMAYLARMHNENVKHCEIMIDPQTHTDRGVPIENVMQGIHNACKDAERKYDMTTVLIMNFLRHLSEEAAFETLKNALPYKDIIAAVGLASSEVGHPPSKFKRVYQEAIKEGFIPIAHAGEEGPPEYIWEALNDLNIVRIDHGNRCLEDQALVDEIKKRNMALTVCPLSNTALRVVDDMKKHPLKTMLKQGINATVNSDDPAYFGGYMIDNYLAVTDALDLTLEDLFVLVSNSFEYSFLPADKKGQYITEVNDVYNKYNVN